jgi:hypothetical protein
LATIAALVTFVSGTAAAQATAPAPQPTPPLESGDTAPPPGSAPAAAPSAPVSPLAPPAAAAPAVAVEPAPIAAPLVVPAPPAPRHVPIYRRNWFWGAIGVVVATGVVVLALTLANQGPQKPDTRLGDMRAF